jgi:hypothetical protein
MWALGFIQKDEMMLNYGHPAWMKCGFHESKSIITSEMQISDHLSSKCPWDAPQMLSETDKAAFLCFDNCHCDDAVSSWWSWWYWSMGMSYKCAFSCVLLWGLRSNQISVAGLWIRLTGAEYKLLAVSLSCHWTVWKTKYYWVRSAGLFEMWHCVV